MKHLILFLLAFNAATAQDEVLPKTKLFVAKSGYFVFEKPPIFTITDNKAEVSQLVGQFAAEISKQTGMNTRTFIGNFKAKMGFSFITKKDIKLGANGYFLDIDTHQITVTAEKPAGYVRAIETLRKLTSVKVENGISSQYRKVKIRCCYVED